MSPNAGEGGEVAGSQPMSTAVQCARTWSPNKLCRSNSIFNLCLDCNKNMYNIIIQCGWLDYVGSAPACYGSSLGSNPNIPQKLEKGNIGNGL